MNGLIDYLEKVRERGDRAVLSALRRGLSGDGRSQAGMHAHVVPFLPKSERLQDAWYSVASLFALHPAKGGSGTLGSALRSVAAKTPSKSIEARFVALLQARSEDLAEHLRHAVNLARSKEVPVDFRRLLKDLASWDHPDQWVQRAWARDYWAGQAAEEDPTEDKEKTQ